MKIIIIKNVDCLKNHVYSGFKKKILTFSGDKRQFCIECYCSKFSLDI